MADGPLSRLGSERLLSWFGDDMSGSIDVMEALHVAGVSSVLLLGPPDAEAADRFPDAAAIGWAGATRALPAAEIRAWTRRATEAMVATGARLIHHKICSTFDSSADVGSIGAMLEVAQDVTDTRLVPVLAAAPRLHRFTCFGNLFARSGWNSPVYRLDRHPTMREHPVTPMHEADLRTVLAEQTGRRSGLLDLVTLRLGPQAARARLAELDDGDCRIAVCDALDDADMLVLGELLWQRATQVDGPLVVGSAGVEHALVAHWRASCALSEGDSAPEPRPPVATVLALSGSRSPVTRRQLARALDRGWAEVLLDAGLLSDAASWNQALRRAADDAARHLACGVSTIVHTLAGSSARLDAAHRERLGGSLGELGRSVMKAAIPGRLMVIGGDSSGHMLRTLGAVALEPAAPFAPAMPFCRIYGDELVEGIEVICKGGQVGGDDLLEEVRAGRPAADEQEMVR